MRFFLCRRWIGLLLATCVVGFACFELGVWQFGRYHERHDFNAMISHNIKAPAQPASSLMSTSRPIPSQQEWRVVNATGHYDARHQFIVLYRTRDGSAGVEVLVPLVTSSGPGLLVDRGWLPTIANGNIKPHLPAPPSGQVTVTGWVRLNSASGAETTPYDGAVRAVSSVDIGKSLPYRLYDGFVQATDESPAAADPLKPTQAPDLWGGPSYFYGIQWWIFAVLGFGFWWYFALTEYAAERRARSQRPPTPTKVTARV